MSLADILRKEGKEKGIEQGKKEKNRQFVHNLLDEGFDISTIAKLTEDKRRSGNNYSRFRKLIFSK